MAISGALHLESCFKLLQQLPRRFGGFFAMNRPLMLANKDNRRDWHPNVLLAGLSSLSSNLKEWREHLRDSKICNFRLLDQQYWPIMTFRSSPAKEMVTVSRLSSLIRMFIENKTALILSYLRTFHYYVLLGFASLLN